MTPPSVAVIVTTKLSPTTLPASNPQVALDCSAATVMVGGPWVNPEAELDRVTTMPPAGAGTLSLTVPSEGASPVAVAGLRSTAVRVTGSCSATNQHHISKSPPRWELPLESRRLWGVAAMGVPKTSPSNMSCTWLRCCVVARSRKNLTTRAGHAVQSRLGWLSAGCNSDWLARTWFYNPIVPGRVRIFLTLLIILFVPG